MVVSAPFMRNVEVRSPTVRRRQSEMEVARITKRSSRNRTWDVWSKTSDDTLPPRLNGETTSIGTRKPSPSGPATPLAVAGNGLTVTYSPGVPAGATGGGTWSKKPSFSSYMMNSTVFDQTSVLEVSVLSTWSMNHAPRSGGDGGCSSYPSGGMIHDTLGSCPERTSAAKSSGKVGTNAFW